MLSKAPRTGWESAMRVVMVAGFLMLSACGGGTTTGTNYSEPPPMATIVATPTPSATPSPEAAANAM